VKIGSFKNHGKWVFFKSDIIYNFVKTPKKLQKNSKKTPKKLQKNSKKTPKKLQKNSKKTPKKLQNTLKCFSMSH